MTRFDELAEGWADGRLDDAERRELAESLSDPVLAERFVLLAGERRALYEALGRSPAEDLGAVFSAPALQPPHRPRRLLLAGGLLAAALLGLAILLLWSATVQPEAVATLLSSHDTEWLAPDGSSVTLQDGASLAPGTRIVTGPAGSAALSLPDGSTAELAGGGDLTVVDASSLHLARGSLAVVALPRTTDPALVVVTPHARCRVLGTRFTVRCDPLGSSVLVEEGLVAWTRDDGSTVTVEAGAEARSGDQLLLGYDFRDGAVRQEGSFPIGLPLLSQDGLAFVEDGLLVRRSDFVAVENPPEADRFIARLQAAERVSLSARVRFATAIPRNLSIATLLCMQAAEPADRFVPVRWKAAGVAAGPAWHEVQVTVERSGRQRFSIDGTCVLDEQRPWPFADWRDSFALLIHTHRDPPEVPIDVVYAWVRIALGEGD